MLFANSNVISKSAVTTTEFTTENEHLIKQLWEKVQQNDAFWEKMKNLIS